MNIEHRTSNIEHRMEDEARPRFDLQERLLDYAAAIIRLCDKIPRSPAGVHVAGQLVRSGTSPLYNHGEAESAESPRDFVHKLTICLKELRESGRALQLIDRVPLLRDSSELRPLLAETDELIRIFVASIRTARSHMVREPSPDSAYDAPNE